MGDGGALEVDPITQNIYGMYSNSNCETPPTNGNQELELRYYNNLLKRGKKATYNTNKQILNYAIYDITATPIPTDTVFKNDYEYDTLGNLVKENYYEGYPFVLRDTKEYYYQNNLLDSIHYIVGLTAPVSFDTKYIYNGSQLTNLHYTIVSSLGGDTADVTFFYNANNKIIKDSSYYSNNTMSITNYIRNIDDQLLFVKSTQGVPNDTIARYTYNTMGNLISSRHFYDQQRYYFYKDIVQPNALNSLKPKFVCSLYPNPSQSNSVLNYYSSDSKSYDFILTDVIGNKIVSISEKGFIGEHSIEIPIKNLNNGIYFVSVFNKNNLQKTLKLIKE